MKTKLKFRQLVTLFALLLGIFVSSCSKEEPLKNPESDSSTNLTLKSAAIPQPDDMICDLIAGQHILPIAGKVIYSHSNGNLVVEFLAQNGWTLSEVHLYVGSQGNLPRNNKAIQIGKFPYPSSNYPAINSNGITTITIPLSVFNNNMNDDDSYTIAAHAVVKNGQQEETAWANCTYKPLITVKSWFNDGSWAASEGTPFSASTQWCSILGTNIYQKGEVYPLIRWNGTNPGKVSVTDNETNLLITVEAYGGLKLTHTYLYVGTMQGLQSYAPPGGCPNYPNFPFKNHTTATTHTFSLPMQSSISFEKAFGSNRWGWFSRYNF
ncbi:MAG: hypothetical protein Q8N05_17290 [Bacteroidota bacterium]|nr:hypothetical protein [Bacteroidota bacterium]